MFELTIKGNVYQFAFNMGFLRAANKTLKAPVDGVPNAEKNVGLRMMIIDVIDGDMESLVNILDLANAGFTPRVTKDLLDDHINNPETDIDKLFETVLDFLEKSNATRKTLQSIKTMAAREGIEI